MDPKQRPVALSALQHWLYCPRQCGLIHLEQLWAENYSTAQGRVLHEKAHNGPDESHPGIRIIRGLEVWSNRHNLKGVCDVVEIQDDGTITPVEYKRGSPKEHQADEVQLCAQAICLEETLGLSENGITKGCLYYGRNRRRVPVVFDKELRQITLSIAREIQQMFTETATPATEYDSKRCRDCSLAQLCQPKAMRLRKGVASWFSRQIQAPEQ